MGVIRGSGAEDGIEREVGRDHKAGSVDEKLAGNVEEDEEEVEGAETEDYVDFRDARLLFEAVESWVLGELPNEVSIPVKGRAKRIPRTCQGWRDGIAPLENGQYRYCLGQLFR